MSPWALYPIWVTATHFKISPHSLYIYICIYIYGSVQANGGPMLCSLFERWYFPMQMLQNMQKCVKTIVPVVYNKKNSYDLKIVFVIFLWSEWCVNRDICAWYGWQLLTCQSHASIMLTHCDIVKPYGDIQLSQHWLRWLPEPLNNADLSSKVFCGIHLRLSSSNFTVSAPSQWVVPQLLFSIMSLKIIFLNCCYNSQGPVN